MPIINQNIKYIFEEKVEYVSQEREQIPRKNLIHTYWVYMQLNISNSVLKNVSGLLPVLNLLFWQPFIFKMMTKS